MSRRPSSNDDLSSLWVSLYRNGRLDNLITAAENYLEENGHYEPVVLTPRPVPLTSRTNGSGLSEEKISECLRVMKRTVLDGKREGGEVDICAICLGEYEEYEMIGIVECGHRFHGECIKGWLLCENVCPLCRATALTI